jgi:SAM-dependent methyltransferase
MALLDLKNRFVAPANSELPIPPFEMRELVGPTDEADFDNPNGDLLFPDLPPEAYESVVDFGCGCGRVARRLMLQKPAPKRYVGVDLHKGIVDWCKKNLAPRVDGFDFIHHDVHNRGFNPKSKVIHRALPVADASASLLIAWSVFTHITEQSAEFYLREVARVLKDGGVASTTFFLFDKSEFPMMQEFQNALYINEVDPTNAVIFDRNWLLEASTRSGLWISRVVSPALYGFHWEIEFSPAHGGETHVEFPLDEAPRGKCPPPLAAAKAYKIR